MSLIAAYLRSRSRAIFSWHSPAMVAMVVMIVYEIWIGSQLPTSGQGVSFADLGTQYLQRSHASAAISAIHSPNPQPGGYDGQFVYYIALDPLNAHYYVDVPAYRYTRILLPMLARLLALGQTQLIAYTLLAINLSALVGGTAAMAAWLRRRRINPWYALLFGFSPGLAMGLELDLTEPLSYALVALAIYLFDFGGRRGLWSAALVFALATLTRETSAVFPFAYAVTLLPWRRRGWKDWARSTEARRAGLFAAIAFVPFLSYKLFLLYWLGSSGTPSEVAPTLLPFQGFIEHYPWISIQIDEIRTVVLPSLLFGTMALWSVLRHGMRDVAVGALLINVLLYVVFLNAYSYWSVANTTRIAAGVIVAAIFALPAIDRLAAGRRLWLWAGGALWLSATPGWVLLPVLRAMAVGVAHGF